LTNITKYDIIYYMSVKQILKELDDKKKEPEPRDDDEILAVALTPVQTKEIIQLFLEGARKTDIARKYDTTTYVITRIIERNPNMRLETEKRYQTTAIARENYRLSETKNKLLTFIDDTLEETINDPATMTTEAKLKVLNNIAALFDKLSITSRLNSEKPSQITESRNLSIDVDKVLKELRTPEDKLNFLRNQNTAGAIIDVAVED